MNSDDKYSFFLRHFHWIGAVAFIAAFILGQLMDDAKGGPAGSQLFFFHASVGLASLGMVALRLLERARRGVPASLDSHADWEKKLSKIIQYGLYIVMIALPVTGVLIVWTKGHPVPFFGLAELGPWVPKSEFAHEAIEEVHEALVPAIFPLLGLHIIGSVKHHFWDKDQTLARISPLAKS